MPLADKNFVSEGTYGIVYSYTENNHRYILKKYKKSIEKSGITDDLIRDIFHYTQPYSKINIYDFGSNHIVLDQYTTDLYGFLADNKYTGTAQILDELKRQILTQIYLTHSYGFLHSDIKLSNILYLDNKNIFSLCDYGLSEFYGFPAVKKRHQCTSYFKPYRRIGRNHINLDIYSLGCVLYYLTGGLTEGGYSRNLTLRRLPDSVADYMSMKSAKKLLSIEVSPGEENDAFLDEVLKSLDIAPSSAIPTTDNILDRPLFYNYDIKNNTLYNYTLRETIYELEYIHDMFLMYSNNPVIVGRRSNIEHKTTILRKYIDSQISLESFFLSILLVDSVEADHGSLGRIAFNFCCKLLEYFCYSIEDVPTNEIVKVELALLRLFFQKEVVFTPVLFFLYYYLYKMAVLAPGDYFEKTNRLEGLGLSMLVLYFFQPVVYRRELTYNELTMDIIRNSVQFIKNGRLDHQEPLNKICIESSLIISTNHLKRLICDMDLLEWLIQNREHHLSPGVIV